MQNQMNHFSLRRPTNLLTNQQNILRKNHPRRYTRPTSKSSRVGPAVPRAFLASKQETVSLPLDFYSILQVNPGVSRESISRAYERCLANAPNAGYSSQALSARSAVLQGALETLAATAARKVYDERFRLGEISEEVPSEYVAGTLMLLQEAGDSQTVIKVGEAWLAQNKRHRSIKDVAIATALAHCDVAKEVLDGRQSVDRAHSSLEAALKLLQTHRAGTAELQNQIESASKDLLPQLALDLLALDNPAARARAFAVLPMALEAMARRSMGTQTEEASRRRHHQMTQTQYLQRLRELLTAEEQVALYNKVGNKLYAPTPAEMYNVAVVHITAGAASAKSSLIHKATELLASAEAQAIGETEEVEDTMETAQAMVRRRKMVDEGHRRSVAACVAWLLLGDSGKAGDALGLRDGRIKCDRQVMAFIRSNSPEPESLLPGVCALVQRWVADVALASFRTSSQDFTSDTFNLDAWFENPKVLRELEMMEPSSGVLSVLTAPFRIIAGVFFGPSSEEPAAVESSQTPAISHSSTAAVPSALETGKEEEPMPEPPVSKLAAAAEPRIPDPPAQSTLATSEMTSIPPPPVPIRTPPSEPAPASAAPTTIKEAFAAMNQAEEEEKEEEAERYARAFADDGELDEGEEEFMAQPIALESIKPLRGEDDWMRRAYATRTIRWKRVAGAAAVLVGAGAFAARSYLIPMISGGSGSSVPGAALPTAFVASSKVLTRTEAGLLVNKWQKIKANALGPKHALADLSSVLAGDLLRQWQDRGAALQAKGWHYTHKLHKCTVESVAAGPHGTAIVTAAFKEGVTVHKTDDTDDAQPQTFVSEYKVVYQVGLNAKGDWVLMQAVVQQNPQ